jgi:hypothetical protein
MLIFSFVLIIDKMNKDRINFSNRVYQQHNTKLIKIIGQGNWSDVYLAYNLDIK